jgi:hypothetical protein
LDFLEAALRAVASDIAGKLARRPQLPTRKPDSIAAIRRYCMGTKSEKMTR